MNEKAARVYIQVKHKIQWPGQARKFLYVWQGSIVLLDDLLQLSQMWPEDLGLWVVLGKIRLKVLNLLLNLLLGC